MKQSRVLFLVGAGVLAIGCGSGEVTPDEAPPTPSTTDLLDQDASTVDESSNTQPSVVDEDVPEVQSAAAALIVDSGVATTVCPTATGGGTATTRAPTVLLTLRDRGEEAWPGAPAVADLNRDGVNEIIAARGQRVVVWNANGTVRWSAAPSTARVWASPLVGDFTGDASLEVVAAAGSRVAMYTAAGALVPGFPATWRDEIRGLAGGDLNADGKPEIVATTTQRLESNGQRDLIKAFRATGAVMTGFPPNTSGAGRCDGACSVTGGYDQNLAVGRIDGDATADILAPMDNAYASWHRGSGEAFPAATGVFRGVTRVPGVRFFTSFAEAQAGWAVNESTAEQAHFTNSAPAIADIDGDGTRELIMLGSIQNAAQTNRRRGVGLFVVRPDGTRPAAWLAPFQARTYLAGLVDFGSNIVAATNQVSVADVDPASRGLEMVFAGFDGRIWCVGADRTTRWSYQYTTANNQVTGGVAIADLSGDGLPEIVFTTYSTAQNTSALFILNSRGVLQHRVALPGRGAMPVPAIADVNRNGTLEIVVSLKDPNSAGAEVLVYTVAGSATNCMPWPMGRLNLLRNGSR